MDSFFAVHFNNTTRIVGKGGDVIEDMPQVNLPVFGPPISAKGKKCVSGDMVWLVVCMWGMLLRAQIFFSLQKSKYLRNVKYTTKRNLYSAFSKLLL